MSANNLNQNNENQMKTIDERKCSSDFSNPTNPQIHVTSSDTASLKSETSSLCRPLRFGGSGTDLTTNGQNKVNDNQVYNPCETQNDGTIGSRSSRLGTLIQCKSDSTEEKTVCCANLAINLYNKALESAKKALPSKSKQRGTQFPRSFGEDFESLGPEGFNYLDDGQTECSYDYRDIEFNRDSMFRPDIFAENTDLPLIINNQLEEPTNLRELQAKYGLPEEADRVQPYKPTVPSIEVIIKTPLNPMPKTNPKSEAKSEMAINKDSELTTDTGDTTTNAIESGIIIRSRSESLQSPPTSASEPTKDPIPSTSSVNVESVPKEPEPIPGPSTAHNFQPNISSSEVLASEPQVVQMRGPSDRVTDDMDLLAKRTSQLIIETAFDSIAKSKAEEILQKSSAGKPSKKSSTESNAKELKKEKKLLEKKLKEEEKNRKKIEKESKVNEKKERKKLFDRFRTEDKQKRKIQKKQKEFEKIKRKMSENKSRDGTRSDAEADIEADDEYEPPEQFRDTPYQDIKTEIMVQSAPEVSLNSPKPVTEEEPKFEVIENIKEIGVTYVPSDDNEEENDGKPKSKSNSFRMPRIESFKTKVIRIFPKKSPKVNKKSDSKSEPKPEEVTTEQLSPTVPEIVIDFDQNKTKLHEYENIDESNVDTKPNPMNELTASQWETEDEDRQQFIDRVSRVESPKKRKKSKTRAKLDRFKAKAIESLPKISSIVPKVKGLVGVGRSKDDTTHYRDMDYERFISDHTSPRHRYDSDFDCVSDSELCDSLRRTGVMGAGLGGRHHVYEEMAATQERVDAYMSPVSGPLRPPRRFSSLKNIQKMASTPTLATQVLLKPKRVPPPRPPPPRPTPPPIRITVETSSNENSLKRRPKQRVPPEIYYNNLRLNFKPKRRFVNLKPKHMEVLATYDEPKPPLPIFSEKHRPTVRAMRSETLQRVNQKNALNTVLSQSFRSNSMPLKERNDLIINEMQPKVAPTPPPRRKRKAQRSQTIDPALDWRPFTWKTRRCRSMTELDVRKSRDMRPRRAHNYENTPPKPLGSRPRTPRPGRPPLPHSSKYYSSISLHSSKRYPSDNYHIYASISRKGPNAGRPLPPPPVPPRPKIISIKPVPLSPKPQTRDVSVSTKDNGLVQYCEKQTQIDGRNQSFCEDFNGNELDVDCERTPTNPLTPTTPTNETKVGFPTTAVTNGNRDLAEQCVGLNESTATLSSVTTTNWFDAENPMELEAHPYKDYDQDTLNDDISSIASVYQSVGSDITVTDSREATPVPEEQQREDTPVNENTRTAPKLAVRSESTRVESNSNKPPERPPTRRSMPSTQTEAEESEEMFGMSRELHSELKSILEKRSSERPDSIVSSEMSYQEKKF